MTLKTCRECGECCRHFAFAKLTQLEIETIEAFTGLHFSIFTYPIGADGADGEGRFLKFRDNGDCFFLNRDEDTFSCLIYEVRSKICRDYPSSQAQLETCDMNRKGVIPQYLLK